MLGRTVAALQEGIVDFEGQQFIQSLLFYISLVGTLLGFVYGFFTESFYNCCISMGITAVVAAVVCIPSWPMYKRHQINWAPHDREKLAQLYAGKDVSPGAIQNKKAVAPAPVKQNSNKNKKNVGADSRKRK